MYAAGGPFVPMFNYVNGTVMCVSPAHSTGLVPQSRPSVIHTRVHSLQCLVASFHNSAMGARQTWLHCKLCMSAYFMFAHVPVLCAYIAWVSLKHYCP